MSIPARGQLFASVAAMRQVPSMLEAAHVWLKSTRRPHLARVLAEEVERVEELLDRLATRAIELRDTETIKDAELEALAAANMEKQRRKAGSLLWIPGRFRAEVDTVLERGREREAEQDRASVDDAAARGDAIIQEAERKDRAGV